tara:strand:- start:86 stop:1240 length:1155 start_codon:yes stop_codon:yes gene_type:complete
MSIVTYKFNTSADADNPNSFTEEHRQAMEGLISLEAYPEKYDNSRFETVEFTGFRIIPASKIRMDTVQPSGTSVTRQQARKGGGINDTETKNLDNSLVTKGSLLSVPPGAVYEQVIDKSYIYITGQSRDGRYKKYHFTNRLVAVYEKKEGFTDDQVQNELSQLGNIFNPKSLPEVEAKDYDIVEEGLRAINNKWIKLDYNEILDRITPQCDAVGIGKTHASKLAMTIMNDKGDNPVLPMTSEKAKEWKDGTKYTDIPDKVRYVIKSYDMSTKGQVDCVKLAKKYPKEEIRVIVHCGIVTGGTEQYISRLTNFWLNWFAQLEAFREVYFDNKPIVPSNLTLYGGVPQCTGEMDVSQVCLFVQDSVEGEFKQKMSDGWKHWKNENN